MAGKRILALDPGTKRMGVALSDELGWTAQPLETYERRTLEADVAHIQDLVRRHEVREVVMGMPFHMSGQTGSFGKQVQEFMHQLEQALPVPVIPWDERLTTRSAEALLIEANVSRKRERGRLTGSQRRSCCKTIWKAGPCQIRLLPTEAYDACADAVAVDCHGLRVWSRGLCWIPIGAVDVQATRAAHKHAGARCAPHSCHPRWRDPSSGRNPTRTRTSHT